MAFDQDACDLYQILSGVLLEDAAKELEDVKVVLTKDCEGGCDDSRHEFELRPHDTNKVYTVVLEVKALTPVA